MDGGDPFDDLLNLEEKFYRAGYDAGLEHGARAGKIEGRTLGLEKGFGKFLESGRLSGRAIVWANRLPRPPSQPAQPSAAEERDADSWKPAEADMKLAEADSTRQQQLPALPRNPRLTKHITTLYALVETASLSTENTDEAVNDFDDRLRRAHGRVRMIERMVGEQQAADAHREPPGQMGQTAQTVQTSSADLEES